MYGYFFDKCSLFFEFVLHKINMMRSPKVVQHTSHTVAHSGGRVLRKWNSIYMVTHAQ